MKEIKIKGKREPVTMAEWKDVKKNSEGALERIQGILCRACGVVIPNPANPGGGTFLKKARRAANKSVSYL